MCKFDEKLVLHRQEFEDLKGLLMSTLIKGESNSLLLLGPRGSGKSELVHQVLKSIGVNDEGDLEGEGIAVYLNGLLQTDDKLALKEITKQLRLETVVKDKIFGSFAQHLEFLLKSLKSGGRIHSRPIIFILEEFDLFCGHSNQTLLYNLFDVAQSQGAPLFIIGISSQLDVIERLEKRVKSRFSHRQIYINNLQNLIQYLDFARSFLTQRGCSKDKIEQFLNHKSTKKKLESIFYIRHDISYLIQILSLTLMHSENDLKEGFDEALKLLSFDFDEFIIENLTLLEVGILIACKHMKLIYEDQPFNFEMVFHEFQKFVTRRNLSLLKYDRQVVLKSFESLISQELITPLDKGTKAQKEYKLYNLQITPETLSGVVNNMKTIPLDVKEWATSELH